MKDGPARLGEFCSAPEAVRAAFMHRLAEAAAAETDFSRWIAEVEDDDPVPPALGADLPRWPVLWDATWSRKAAARVPRAGEQTTIPDRDADPLLRIPAPEFFEGLTGEPVPSGGGTVRCPLPDHDDRTPSCQVYPDDRGWYCFACNRGGTVYDLAAELSGLPARGPEFLELRRWIADRLLNAPLEPVR